LIIMQDIDGFDADILVVGLGPTGDVLSCLLAQEGLSVIAIDREPDIFQAPRAAVFDHEIMRIFQQVGVAEAVAKVCRVPERYQFVTAADEVLLDFPIAALAPVSGWAENYLLHQPAVERALRDRLAETGVDVRLGTRLLAHVQQPGGVVSRVASAEGEVTLRTRYLVACDGGSSPVRESLGIALLDYQFDEPWLVIDALVEDDGHLPQRLLQICDPRRPVSYLKMAGPRYRWEFMIKPGEDPAELIKDESIHRLLAPWGGVDKLTIERRAVYRFHGLVAEQWRQGRVLLAGDAAHQMPPFAGQGMCAGVRDAVNLAWKLAMIVRGEAADTLLDSYQIEREPHVRVIIETAIAMGRVVCLLDEAAAAGRNAQMLARKAAGEADIALAFPPLAGGMLTDLPGAGFLFPQPVTTAGRLDDHLGQGAWLIGRDLSDVDGAGVKLFGLDDAPLAPFRSAIGDWLDQFGVDAVLVRPDRHVFGAGSASDLVTAWKAKLADGGGASEVSQPRVA
jgi:3-(3-hydroxy-phenyl)propionate hydroxylase